VANSRPSMHAHWLLLLLSICLVRPARAQTDRWSDLSSRAAQLASTGRLAEALPVAQDALKEAESAYGKQSTNYGLSLNAIGFLTMSTGDLTGADGYYTQAVAIISQALGPNSLQLATPYANQAQLHLLQAARATSHPTESNAFLQQAEGSARKVLALMEKNYTSDDPILIQPLEGLSYVLGMEKDMNGAKPVLTRMLKLETASLPPDHMQIIRTRNSLAWVLNATGDKAGAVDQYKLALASARKTLGDTDPFTSGIRDALNALQGGSASIGRNAVSNTYSPTNL
jgi:hypothetical protein